MCDAWLGGCSCGDGESPIVYRAAWSARQNMHQEIVRLGVSPGSFHAEGSTSGCVVAPSINPSLTAGLTVALARMLAMGTPPDFKKRPDTLKEAPPTGLARWGGDVLPGAAVDRCHQHPQRASGDFRDDRCWPGGQCCPRVAYAHLRGSIPPNAICASGSHRRGIPLGAADRAVVLRPNRPGTR